MIVTQGRRKPAFQFFMLRQPVERALQNEDRGMLVDHRGAFFAADVGGDQLAFDRGGGQPLVPQRDRQIGELGEIARKRADRLRARSFAAVHVARQAEHEADAAALRGEREQSLGIQR